MVEMTLELAEICGIHAGDGYLRGPNKRAELDISGNIEEKQYYDNHVRNLFKKVFGIDTQCRHFSSRNTYGFVIRDKLIIRSMHELGFPYGNKSTIIEVPLLIKESQNKEIISNFIRGYFDTDGCLFLMKRNSGKYGQFKKTHHYYPSVRFSTVSLSLHRGLKDLLIKLGFREISECIYNSKNPQENKKYIIILYGSKNTNKFFQEIGSKNPVKLSRFLVWKKLGYCPAHTTLEQREEMLKREDN